MSHTILYLGLEVPQEIHARATSVVHYPVIQIVPRSIDEPDIQQAFKNLKKYSHLIFTSKTAFNLFCELSNKFGENFVSLLELEVIAVGVATGRLIKQKGFKKVVVATDETAEGVVKILSETPLKGAYLFWPHSEQARPVIRDFLKQFNHNACPIYKTISSCPQPIPELSKVDEIVFTSPSTVDAFLKIYGRIPNDKTITPIGPITAQHLNFQQYNRTGNPGDIYESKERQAIIKKGK